MTHVAIFAKYWQPGSVKTRLAATLGDEPAAEVYQQFVFCLLRRLQYLGDSRELVFSPESSEARFRNAVYSLCGNDAWRLNAQGTGDLGERMERYFARTLSHTSKSILIGSDSPTIPASVFEETISLLDRHDVVLGPSEDGGYYLVAAKQSVPPIFHGIDWSTEQVWPQTVQFLERANVKFATLPEWYDVDNEDDLQRLMGEITASHDGSHHERSLASLRTKLEQILN